MATKRGMEWYEDDKSDPVDWTDELYATVVKKKMAYVKGKAARLKGYLYFKIASICRQHEMTGR
jgi:hypothetical protein